MPDPTPFNQTGLEPVGTDPFAYWYRMKPPRPFNLTEMEEDDRVEKALAIASGETFLGDITSNGEASPSTHANMPMLNDPQLNQAIAL